MTYNTLIDTLCCEGRVDAAIQVRLQLQHQVQCHWYDLGSSRVLSMFMRTEAPEGIFELSFIHLPERAMHYSLAGKQPFFVCSVLRHRLLVHVFSVTC